MNKTSRLLWGKTDDHSDLLHPLLFHMMDAGNVAAALWSFALPETLKKELASALNLKTDAAGRLISFLTSLHDIGKAGPSFQSKLSESVFALAACGLPFPNKAAMTPIPHGLVTAWILCSEGKRLGLEEDSLEALARVLGGHHGAWPDAEMFDHPARKENLGGAPWQLAREEIWEILTLIFEPPGFSFPPDGVERNILLTLCSGLVSVADWLASMQSSFPAAGSQCDWEEYLPLSISRAQSAVIEQGWTIWNDPSADSPIHFKEAFPLLSEPRPVQTAVFEHAFDTPLPSLALIEAPTGIGKTEIAFLLADYWLWRSGGRGLYVAMPTQATSNQMYDRAKAFLRIRYPNQPVNLHLAHGHALLQEDFEKTVISNVDQEPSAGVAASAWFLPRKRTLLAPFGVGTVDQVFLSVLQTRHFFVRLFGLHGKVVIFDEVHAYDAYQSELFCRLLAWLHALNVSVILLSATLPESIREKLITAYGGKQKINSIQGYPRLTLVSQAKTGQYILPASVPRAVALDQLGHEPSEVVTYLSEKLADGGCAAVICNTVARAQAIYQEILNANLAPGATYLFHARFPFAWRDQIEKSVLGLFAPQGVRPQRAIVVATQVIEQSLDLDFDLMVTELAPIDLLIQRAGRLHRHHREGRPKQVSSPRLALMETRRTPEGDPDFGPDGYVYRRYHLLKTGAVLRGRSMLMLPEETPVLIEAVYGDQPIDGDEQAAANLAQARHKMEEDIKASVQQARRRMVLTPDRDDLLTRRVEILEEEAPAIHADFLALTREAPPGVSLVCLHRQPDGRISLEPDDITTMIDIDHVPGKEDIKKLLRHTLQIQRPEVVRYFAGQPPHSAWKEVAPLRYLFPVLFENGLAPLKGLPMALQLHRELGLSFLKEVL